MIQYETNLGNRRLSGEAKAYCDRIYKPKLKGHEECQHCGGDSVLTIQDHPQLGILPKMNACCPAFEAEVAGRLGIEHFIK